MDSSSTALRHRSQSLLRTRLQSLGIADTARVTAAEAALQRELDLIEQYEIAPLFTFLCDYAGALEKHDQPVQAIGIAGGSMLLFASGLCHVFPTDEGLLFEHFFDGSKFYSVARKLTVFLDVPQRISGRMAASWARKARAVRANGIGVQVECTPRRYLSIYRCLRRRSKLVPPTRLHSYWPQIDPGRLIPTATRFFARDYGETAWSPEFAPQTWSQLVLCCGRSARRPADAQLLRDICVKSHSLRHLDPTRQETETRLLAQATLCYREDVMAHAQRTMGISLGLVSRLMLAVCKQQQERMDELKEAFLTAPDARKCPAAEVEAEFELVLSRAVQATSKAHACSRALWAAYLAYALPR